MDLKDQFESFCRFYRNDQRFGLKMADTFGPALSGSQARPPFIWFEANACSGDSISTLNATKPNLGQILCSFLEIRYWNALMPGQGGQAVQRLLETVETGDFILAVEGAVATAGRGRYAIPFKQNNYLFTSEELVKWMALKAKYVVAVGTCAAFGGPSAARPNPSNSKGVWEVFSGPVVNVPGCPINPDWLLGTLFHLLLFGLPEVDRYQRPTLFYGQTIHSLCQRRSYFDNNSFAQNLGDPECMISLGCMGPVTGADCPYRLWNDHLNWPVKAGTPCIGCTKSGFPDKSTPFYTPLREKMPKRLKEGSSKRNG
ncbi:MAG: hydrogenase small subunit [Bacillota bacterium]